MPYTEFHYTPTGTGVISGKEVLEQTVDAINDLGGQMSGDVQTAIDTANNALNTANTASADAQNAVNTVNTAYTAATNAQNTASNALTAAQNAQNDVNALGNRVTTAEGNITQNTNAITGLTTRMGTAEGKITTLQNNVITAQGTATSAQNTATLAKGQAYVVRYASVAVSDNSTVPYTDLNNTDNVKVNDLLLDTNGKLYQISAVDTSNETVSVTTPLTQLAVDSDFVHTSGNETVDGIKTFNNVVPIDGAYLGNELSDDWRTNICLRSNTDTADKSGAYISRFRQDRWQGALQTGDLQMIGFDVLENEVRTNNVFSIQCSGWLDNVPTKVKLISTGSYSTFGSFARPSKINDINPGALSLPDLNNGIDISGYISYDANKKYDNTYTVPADGYITIYGTGGNTSGIIITNGNCAQTSYSLSRADFVYYVGVTLPVSARDVVTIGTNNVTSLINAKFYPCQGNV